MSETMTDRTAADEDVQGFETIGRTLGAPRALRDVALIAAVAVVMIGGLELWLRLAGVPLYVLPPPSAIAVALGHQFWPLLPHVGTTLFELGSGFAIGASLGFVLAMVVTQFPLVEKIVTPYILLMVTTPMIALCRF